MSSMVAMPSTPPYSSITTVMWFLVSCKRLSNTGSSVVGSTHKGLDIICRMSVSPLRVLKSFSWRMPTMLSTLPSYTGMRE